MGDDQVADFASSVLAAISCWHYRARALLSTRFTTVRVSAAHGFPISRSVPLAYRHSPTPALAPPRPSLPVSVLVNRTQLTPATSVRTVHVAEPRVEFLPSECMDPSAKPLTVKSEMSGRRCMTLPLMVWSLDVTTPCMQRSPPMDVSLICVVTVRFMIVRLFRDMIYYTRLSC